MLTARTGAGGPAVQETLSVLHRADATFVRLAAMTPDAVADMVCDAVRAKADASLLDLAAKAHGNPFLVSELVGGLGEEGRLNLSGGRAMVTGDGLPRRLGATMHQRLDLLSGRRQSWCGWPRCCRTGFRLACWPRCWSGSRRRCCRRSRRRCARICSWKTVSG